jgi:hypothetical protein
LLAASCLGFRSTQFATRLVLFSRPLIAPQRRVATAHRFESTETPASGSPTSRLRNEQRSTVSELVDSYCQRVGGTPAQLAEATGIEAGRFSSYLDGRGVTDLTTAEMAGFMTMCSKLEKARSK